MVIHQLVQHPPQTMVAELNEYFFNGRSSRQTVDFLAPNRKLLIVPTGRWDGSAIEHMSARIPALENEIATLPS